MNEETTRVTVYTKPRCPQCEATKRQLTRQGVEFDTVDITSDPAILAEIQAAGFRQAPVVMTADTSWSGYRPDLIRAIASQPVSA